MDVLLGTGSGSFFPYTPYSAGSAYGTVALADLNGDQKLDILAMNGSALTVLLGNGDGTFQAARNFSTGGTSGQSLHFAVADFNGDGKLDVGVMNAPSGNIGVLLGNGDGSFQSPLNFNGVTRPGTQSASADVADFDGDGRLDLVTTNPSANTISIFLQGSPATSPQITLSSSSVDFPGNPLGVNCSTKGVTITNNGPSDLIISSLSPIAAPFVIDASSTTCAVEDHARGFGARLRHQHQSSTPAAVGTVPGTLTITTVPQRRATRST